ncbi:LppW family protein [Blastococcus sp. CT_GayMR20]|uniref:serine hydrolase n=1 Tax=Blastococcus sp. CT_GayMR20 TaxID=2559609 RepID=UPI0010741788|nr:serine hydrolase [Blastococcus sp. CT_GayMR20]TFV87890.1 LppW family protein [Blastococcus sp. CT_GayMR20]
MATVTVRRPGSSRLVLLPLTLLAVLFAEVALPGERRAAAGGRWASEVVPAVVAAYGQDGTIAVAVARQQERPSGEPVRGYEARRIRAAGWSADNGAPAATPIPTASMVKLFMAEDILHRSRVGLLSLTRADFAQLQAMIRHSDDPAASALWVRYGGGRMVSDVAARYGLAGTTPPTSPGQWGSTMTTARDLARFLSLLPVVAHPADAGALMVWMRTATPVAADGFLQRFGLFGTAPPLTAVKQGWMCCIGGQRHLHSVGVIGHRVVVLLSAAPRSVSYEAASAALTAAAAALPPPRHS